MLKERPGKGTKIKGHCMQVRQHPSEKEKKGTIRARGKFSKRGKKRKYRCRLRISSRLQRFCVCKKANSYCLKGGDWGGRCPQLVMSYQ
jgi:hypothetical protein